MSKRIAIPTLRCGVPAIDKAFAALKTSIENLTGQHGNVPALEELPDTATLAQVIAQQNKIVKRLEGD